MSNDEAFAAGKQGIELSFDYPADPSPDGSLDDASEHILIEDELGGDAVQPRTIDRQRVMLNRLCGRRTELSIYAEGFVRIREGTAQRVLKDHLCELRFLGRNCETTRSIASAWGWAALAAALLAVAAFMLSGSGWTIAGIAAIALTLASAFCLWQFARRSIEEHVFATATGHAAVFTLRANLGCFGQMRKAADELRQALSASNSEDLADARRLRAEMRAHYQLLERGVISEEACSQGTSQILARFG